MSSLGPYARTSQARTVLQDLGLNILLYKKQTRLINSKYLASSPTKGACIPVSKYTRLNGIIWLPDQKLMSFLFPGKNVDLLKLQLIDTGNCMFFYSNLGQIAQSSFQKHNEIARTM